MQRLQSASIAQTPKREARDITSLLAREKPRSESDHISLHKAPTLLPQTNRIRKEMLLDRKVSPDFPVNLFAAVQKCEQYVGDSHRQIVLHDNSFPP